MSLKSECTIFKASIVRQMHSVAIRRHEVNINISAASAIMEALYLSITVKRELSLNVKLLIYQSIYVLTIT